MDATKQVSDSYSCASGCCPLCRQRTDDLTPLQNLVDRALALYFRREFLESARVAQEALDIDAQHVHMKCDGVL